MKIIRNADKLTHGLILAGTVTAVASGLRALTEASDKDRKSVRGTGAGIYYGLLGAASLYKLARTFGPKTKEELRLMKVSKIYDRAEAYQHRANLYRRTAESIMKRRFKNLKPTTS